MVQFAGSASAAALVQDGNELGSLQSFTIGADGVVTGVFSNGRNRPLAQLALATFTNPGGLEKAGGSSFTATVNSGQPPDRRPRRRRPRLDHVGHARDVERRPRP